MVYRSIVIIVLFEKCIRFCYDIRAILLVYSTDVYKMGDDRPYTFEYINVVYEYVI